MVQTFLLGRNGWPKNDSTEALNYDQEKGVPLVYKSCRVMCGGHKEGAE